MITLDGTNGIDTPDLESSGPVTGTTGTFSGAVSGTTGTFSGNVTLGSSVLATPTGSAPSYTCRAWVNFNGTGTVAIRASGNVSSITDNGTGDYTVNVATALPDTNYCTVFGNSQSVGNTAVAFASNPSRTNTTSAVQVSVSQAGVRLDLDNVTLAVFR